MKTPPRITEAEWRVMKVIWKKAPCSAQTVIDALAAPNDWSVGTIKTLLNRLMNKGVLKHEKSGKAYTYSAALTEAECRGVEADSFVARVFDGSLSPLLAHFVKTKQLRQQDIAELEEILRASRKKP